MYDLVLMPVKKEGERKRRRKQEKEGEKDGGGLTSLGEDEKVRCGGGRHRVREERRGNKYMGEILFTCKWYFVGFVKILSPVVRKFVSDTVYTGRAHEAATDVVLNTNHALSFAHNNNNNKIINNFKFNLKY